MDNYLLMGHILKCKVIPKSEVHPELWIGADKKFKKVPMARVYRVSHNKVRLERVDSQVIILADLDVTRFVAEDGGREGQGRQTVTQAAGTEETKVEGSWNRLRFRHGGIRTLMIFSFLTEQNAHLQPQKKKPRTSSS